MRKTSGCLPTRSSTVRFNLLLPKESSEAQQVEAHKARPAKIWGALDLHILVHKIFSYFLQVVGVVRSYGWRYLSKLNGLRVLPSHLWKRHSLSLPEMVVIRRAGGKLASLWNLPLCWYLLPVYVGVAETKICVLGVIWLIASVG